MCACEHTFTEVCFDCFGSLHCNAPIWRNSTLLLLLLLVLFKSEDFNKSIVFQFILTKVLFSNLFYGLLLNNFVNEYPRLIVSAHFIVYKGKYSASSTNNYFNGHFNFLCVSITKKS